MTSGYPIARRQRMPDGVNHENDSRIRTRSTFLDTGRAEHGRTLKDDRTREHDDCILYSEVLSGNPVREDHPGPWAASRFDLHPVPADRIA
jgi:hypothetical protein